jgi:hypothetical protein
MKIEIVISERSQIEIKFKFIPFASLCNCNRYCGGGALNQNRPPWRFDFQSKERCEQPNLRAAPYELRMIIFIIVIKNGSNIEMTWCL